MTGIKNVDGGVILWLDYSKFGTLSNNELNNTVNIVAKALAVMPENSCCFIVAPLLASERRSGFREEFRSDGLGWDG